MTETDVAFDLDTLTLGELIAAEDASGLTGQTIMARMTYRLLLGVFVQRLRSSGQPPSWRELEALRISDVSPGRSPTGSPSARSNGSD
jgi:hypothetical protein